MPLSLLLNTTLILLLMCLPTPTRAMCFEPAYRTTNYHKASYSSSPFIIVGRVVETKQNSSHQAVKLFVTCVYKSPLTRRETVLHQEINFTMQHKRICEPLLRTGQSYFFFFEEKVCVKKNRRKKKKKNNKASDFTRMSQQKKKYISLASPIPVGEMDSLALESLVEQVRGQNYTPIGHCYNVWSPWTACSALCGVGSMDRSFPRHTRPDLVQQAVCHNSPCQSSEAGRDGGEHDDNYQYQPVRVKNCKSMGLVRVNWCDGRCRVQNQVKTAVSWEMSPVLMLCVDPTDESDESLQYFNVAIPSTCGCIDRGASRQKYAIIDDPSEGTLHHTRSRKRNIHRDNFLMTSSRDLMTSSRDPVTSRGPRDEPVIVAELPP